MSGTAYLIEWTVWNQERPVHTTQTHLIDHENNWKREGARTLCGMTVGWDSSKGYGSTADCKRCQRIAERKGMEVV